MDDDIVGVLVFNYDISAIEKITESVYGLGDKGEIILLTQSNYAINSLNKKEDKDFIDLGDDFVSDLKKQIEEGEPNPWERIDDYAGDFSITTLNKLNNFDWYLLVEVDYYEMLQPVYLILALELAVMLIITIIGGIGAGRIAKKVAEPLEELADNVQLVTKGELTKKVKINSRDEIGTLSGQIDQMAEALMLSQKNVDKKVKQQTEELSEQRENLRNQQLALMNILEDVNDEKDEIDRQRSKLDIILEGIGDGVFAVDKDFIITRFNKVATQLTGFTAKEAVGKKFDEILEFRKEKDDSLYYDFIFDAVKKGDIQTMANHTYVVRKDSSTLAVADSAAPIIDDEGNVSGCVVVFRDVAKEREVNKMKDEFISVASHQLRTPLTGVKWFLQILSKEEDGKLSTKQREYIMNVYNSNERMIKLVDDLLSVSRIDTGRKFDIKKKKINLVEVLNNTIRIQSVIAKVRDIEIICQKSCPTKLVVNADADKLMEVFSNILSNAIKYSKDKGKVMIGYKEEKESYVFSIRDNGLGIPEEQQDKVFSKFFRAENVKKHQVGGTGLGLYIAQSIIDAHGGDIWFESKESKGTTFYIKIKKA